MALDRITLSSFRNHRSTTLEGTGKFNLLVGENGAGKTNIIEAISLLAPGRGLRRAALGEMAMRGGEGGFAVACSLDAGDGGEPVRLSTSVDPARPGRRQARVNGADTSAVSLGEWLSIGWLIPAMDGLFTDSAGARRRFMDRLAVALEPHHARHAARYEASLRERNRLLSGETAPDPAWLDAIEARMAEYGAALIRGRETLVSALREELAAHPAGPFARPALTRSQDTPADPEHLAANWRSGRERDRAAGRTLSGPHRDDLVVTMEAKAIPAGNCSTGEQKAMLVSIALAHSALAARGRPGILLLDEVAAHLDPVRRAALFERLEATGAQVWLTGTELAPFEPMPAGAATWEIAEGEARRLA